MSTSRRLSVIVNPVAGFRRGKRLAKFFVEILSRKGYEVEFYETKHPGDAEEYLRKNSDIPLVVCIGGDGTINEVVNGLGEGSSSIISFIPAGTSNVFAKEMKLPKDFSALLQIITSGNFVSWDVGINLLSGRKFILMASAGFDSIVVQNFLPHRRGIISQLNYLIWGLRIFPSYKPPRITVEIDGKIVEREATFVEIANVSSYGGPLVFTPNARPDDGFFDIFIYRRRKKLDCIWLYGQSFISSLTSSYSIAGSYILRGKRVGIFSDEKIPLQMDGDPAGFLPARFEVLPNYIRLASL
jgi:diacylglycerol kinase (ATP)